MVRVCVSLLGLHSHETSCAVGLAILQQKPVKAYEIIGSALDPAAQVSRNVLTVKQLLAPLSRDQIGLVRCLGLNYADHAVRNPPKYFTRSLQLTNSHGPIERGKYG